MSHVLPYNDLLCTLDMDVDPGVGPPISHSRNVHPSAIEVHVCAERMKYRNVQLHPRVSLGCGLGWDLCWGLGWGPWLGLDE